MDLAVAQEVADCFGEALVSIDPWQLTEANTAASLQPQEVLLANKQELQLPPEHPVTSTDFQLGTEVQVVVIHLASLLTALHLKDAPCSGASRVVIVVPMQGFELLHEGPCSHMRHFGWVSLMGPF